MNRFFNLPLIVAIALHAMLLAIPLAGSSSSTEAKSADPETEKSPGAEAAPTPTKSKTALLPETPATTLKSPNSSMAATKSASAKSAIASQPKKTVAKPAAVAPTKTAPAKPAPKAQAVTTRKTPTIRTVPAPRPAAAPVRPLAPAIAPPAPSSLAATSPGKKPTVAPNPTPRSNPKLELELLQKPPEIPVDPFTKIPFYPLERSLMGSLSLLPLEEDRKTYAFNTGEELGDAIAFYNKELPEDIFKPLELESDGTDMTIYKLEPKNGEKAQYLHFIPFRGKTVIVLLPKKIEDLDEMKAEAIKRQQKRRDFLQLLSQMKRIREQMRSLKFSDPIDR